MEPSIILVVSKSIPIIDLSLIESLEGHSLAFTQFVDGEVALEPKTCKSNDVKGAVKVVLGLKVVVGLASLKSHVKLIVCGHITVLSDNAKLDTFLKTCDEWSLLPNC